ncbi:MAG: pilus assembly protein N-terminal domain-containing protein [Xanthobacteraceae bacterium]
MLVALRRSERSGVLWAQGIVIVIAAALMISTAGAAETLVITLDEARITKLPDRVATVVIGNPLIADATAQPGGTLVITGKGYGMTNVIALDRSGSVLMEKNVAVQGPSGNVVVVYRGVERETYSCAPQCQRRITLGDAQPFFESTLAQTRVRNTEAVAATATR